MVVTYGIGKISCGGILHSAIKHVDRGITTYFHTAVSYAHVIFISFIVGANLIKYFWIRPRGVT